ncbi:unnamed protein product [Euphydryas editha]|uniref:Uncharacterized protein n=1 Tax=Euphydryas editha TaxID=104508 RepID=A0AAU9TIS3_EUPED|nr:unnamed protein product [Euphydryas editha]
MSDILKCCVKEDSNNIIKMDKIDNMSYAEKVNGHTSCPFSDEQVLTVNNEKQEKPNLRLKVPQPIRLKNHLVGDENFDHLHSQIEDVSFDHFRSMNYPLKEESSKSIYN